MLNKYLIFLLKTLVCGLSLVILPLNAIRFFKNEYYEKRDWEIASYAIKAHEFLYKTCQSAAALVRINEAIDDQSPEKKTYAALIKRLDLLAEGLAASLDGDELLAGLIPHNQSQQSRINRLANQHHQTIKGIVAEAAKEYPVLVSLAKKQVNETNKQHENMLLQHREITDLISTTSTLTHLDKMEQYNSTHEVIYKILQELYDSLCLRIALDQALSHLNISTKIEFNDLHSLITKVQTQFNMLKESAQRCHHAASLSRSVVKLKDKRTKGVGTKTEKLKNSLDGGQMSSHMDKLLKEIEDRKILPRLITKKLLCPANFSLIPDMGSNVQKLLDAHRFNGIGHVTVETVDDDGKAGTVKTILFFADKDKEMAIKPAFVTPIKQLLVKTKTNPILFPFTTHQSVCKIAQAETGDCYLSRDEKNFYKVSSIVGLMTYNEEPR